MDEESSWEDSSVIRVNASKAKVSPVNFLILMLNLVFPMVCFMLYAIYLQTYSLLGFIGITIICSVIYPLIMIKLFRQMDGVWSRIKGAPLMEGNQGKIMSFASFFFFLILTPLWAIVPSLREIKPEGDALQIKELTILIVIEIAIFSFYYMFILPIITVFYWNLYLYECFGYSIRLGILKWLISICYGFCAYFFFEYLDGPVAGMIAVCFFTIYCRISLWMRKKFGYLCSIFCNIGLNIGSVIAIVIKLNYSLIGP
ncbi:unnamed protein product [Moneuplotes crassus]|uniref:Uncharacterized protein n=1 Tax=Euplotes crassus TaxID=5936 RepID=A0AAD1XRU9_EUPCR|nr:unnamed protein product [Moneuplotes crassus]